MREAVVDRVRAVGPSGPPTGIAVTSPGSVRRLSENLPPSRPVPGFTAGGCAGSDPKRPPGDPERRERTGACDRTRFLEAMAWECSAAESLLACRTLCEPRPNA